MDTLAVELPMAGPKPRHGPAGAGLVARLAAQVLAGKDAVVLDAQDGGAALLHEATPQLMEQGCRVVPVSASVPGGLNLSALLAQVVARPDLQVQDDETLERGFEALTVPGPGFDRVVLAIDGAEAVQTTVFRYLAFACKAAPALQLVLAGRTEPTARLGEDDGLRARLTACPPLLAGPAPAPTGAVTRVVAEMSPREPAPLGARRQIAWLLAGAGIAAVAALGFGLGRETRPAAVTAVTEPATPSAPPPRQSAAVPPAPPGPAARPAGGGVAAGPPGIPPVPPAQESPPPAAVPSHAASGAPPVPATASAPPPAAVAAPGATPAAAPERPATVASIPATEPPPQARQTSHPGRNRSHHAADAETVQPTGPTGHPEHHARAAERTAERTVERTAGRAAEAGPLPDDRPTPARTVIGSFVTGPDGVRLFHANP